MSLPRREQVFRLLPWKRRVDDEKCALMEALGSDQVLWSRRGIHPTCWPDHCRHEADRSVDSGGHCDEGGLFVVVVVVVVVVWFGLFARNRTFRCLIVTPVDLELWLTEERKESEWATTVLGYIFKGV